MTDHKAKTLRVAGAAIHYETWGSGPLLVMIPGGPQDAGVFAGLAGELAGRYTVLSFDPRGNSRTVTDAPPGDLDVNLIADDVAALIAAVLPMSLGQAAAPRLVSACVPATRPAYRCL